ncbi:uncharacterized protein LOC123871344 [Maniola jurtina]|uniref:uncharacterized protein LOC123871344 n=1 Tax=Maniola jurtina TaxID=191418 RepID=UPI001E68AC46|nr:uncharacterized protein LOC123871344 [Maniola jurtina]XP_045771060.1 uncharacterized protein LOC123871344 [Maniola jurtina]
MARVLVLLAFGLLACQECSPRGLPEAQESVVSVYDKGGTNVDVYRQIANNLAEKITSPIYSFLGYGKNKTEKATTTKPWDKIEILDDPETVSKANQKPVDNDISLDKEVEELSSEALRRMDKKPEKLTLYSSYLPSGKIEKLDGNDTTNEISDDDETFGFDDVDDSVEDVDKTRASPIVYFLEIVGSIIQLIYGGIVAFFSSSSKPTN